MRVSKPRLAAAATLALSILLGSSAGAPTAFGDDPSSKVTKAQDEVDKLTEQLVAADKKLKDTDKKVADADKKVKSAQNAVAAAQKKQTDAKAAFDKAKKEQDGLQSDLDKTLKAKDKAQRGVGSLARYSFESGGLGPLTFTIEMLTAKHDVSGALGLSDVLIQRQQGLVRTLDKTKKDQESKVKALAEKTRLKNLAKAREDAAVTSAKDSAKKASDAKKELTTLQDKQRKDRQDLDTKKKAALASLKEAQDELTRIQNLTKTSPNLDPASTTVTGNGFLSAPMPASAIVSPYGYRIHPVLHYRKLHAGDDYPFACGQPVFAAADGTVIESGYNGISGNHVVISHGAVNGTQLATAYMHFQTAPMVSVGQKVKRGQQIGIAGMTGRVTGCHLHFEVHENGVAVNPLKWVN